MNSREPNSIATPAVKKSPLKPPTKRKQWNKLSMIAAVQEVENGMSTLAAARKHGVPRSTLHDRVTGRVKHGVNPGPAPYLSANEEKQLFDFLLLTRKIGYHKTRVKVARIVENIAQDKKVLRTDRLSNTWISTILKRHPEVTVTNKDASTNLRINEETMKNYFEELKKIMNEHNLNAAPMQIYTADETVLSKEQQSSKVKARAEQQKASYGTSLSNFQVTVIGCVNALGHAIPPFVIFDSKTLNDSWKVGEVPGTTYEMSPNGRVNTEIFHSWFQHFLKNAVSARPLLLLLDGHSFHYQPSFIQLARDENVIVFCLPPDTLDVSQPPHASLYGPTLKAHWHLACFDYVQDNPGKVVTKFQFSTLLNEAWTRTMTSDNIGSKFRTCGIYPYNPSASVTIPNHNEITENDEDMETSGGQRNKQINEDSLSTTDCEIYNTKYQEDCNIFDESYYAWLQVNHPEYAKTWLNTAITLQPMNNTKAEAEAITSQSMANDEAETQTSTTKYNDEADGKTACTTQSNDEPVIGTISQTTTIDINGKTTNITQSNDEDETQSSTSVAQSMPNDELYRRRYEEGDKFDENYYTWLQMNHPEDAVKWHQTVVAIQPHYNALQTHCSFCSRYSNK